MITNDVRISNNSDGCRFYILKDSSYPIVMMCYHPASELEPVTFVLIHAGNKGISEKQSYSIFRAVCFETGEISNNSNKSYTPSVITSSSPTAFVSENSNRDLECCWESINSETAEWETYYATPFKQLQEEVKEILENCKKRHKPLSGKSLL